MTSSGQSPLERQQRHARGRQSIRLRSAVIACHKCHERKVKCSGDVPCQNCVRSQPVADCTYPNRNRTVKVKECDLAELLEENRRLRGSTTPTQVANDLIPAARAAPSQEDAITESSGPAEANSNPTDMVKTALLHGNPWFFVPESGMPILLGEATDAAFASKFRHILANGSPEHFPRTQYAPADCITSIAHADWPWPSPARARFLIIAALNTAGRRYYLTRRSSVFLLLERALGDPRAVDMVSAYKLFALFALGKAYSTRAARSEEDLPGMRYYAFATHLLRSPDEKPTLCCVEVLNMLAIYSLFMNRRHSAYCIVGSAVRFGIILGLHLNVGEHQLPSRDMREHRVRLWWTIYILDRSWTAMLGQPVSIQDDDVEVDVPSLDGCSQAAAEDFDDTEYLVASIRVARLAAQITSSIYTRRKQKTSISSRVQQALHELKELVRNLPAPVHRAGEELPPNAALPMVTLHLYLNQCLILATRPIILHVLRLSRGHPEPPSSVEDNETKRSILALSEACIQCARRSYRVLADSWITGFFPTFDYTYTQYLFSSATILAISSLLSAGGEATGTGTTATATSSGTTSADSDDFESAIEILQQLEQNGSYTAAEFMRHAEATKLFLKAAKQDRQINRDNRATEFAFADAAPSGVAGDHSGGASTHPAADPEWSAAGELSLHGLLCQSDFDLHLLDSSVVDDAYQNFLWPPRSDNV